MKCFQAKSKGTEELKQIFQKLEQDWQAINEPKSKTTSRKYLTPSNTTTAKTIDLIREASPRSLMSNLQQQQSPSPTWDDAMMSRTNDLAAQEILQERRLALRRRKFKGRRLFQSPENNDDDDDENRSREVSPTSFPYEEGENTNGCYYSCYCCCWRSSCLTEKKEVAKPDTDADLTENVNGEAVTVATETKNVGNGRRYCSVLFRGVVFALLVVGIYYCLESWFSSEHGSDVRLVPT